MVFGNYGILMALGLVPGGIGYDEKYPSQINNNTYRVEATPSPFIFEQNLSDVVQMNKEMRKSRQS